MPGALERLDKDYQSMQKNNSMTNSQMNFISIRSSQKSVKDVTQMSPFQRKTRNNSQAQTLTEQRMNYNSSSKACIPSYNIKTQYNTDIKPFFSPQVIIDKLEQTDKENNIRASIEGLDDKEITNTDKDKNGNIISSLSKKTISESKDSKLKGIMR